MQTESVHSAEFLLTYANGRLSFDTITMAATATRIEPGTLLGKVTATGNFKPYANGASDGSEVCAGVLYARAPINAAVQKAVIVNYCAEVSGAMLIGADSAGIADLLALTIKVR